MIKILYLIDRIKAAGAQKHLIKVIGGLDKTKFQPQLCLLEKNSVMAEPQVPIYCLNVKRIYGASGIRGLFQLIALIHKEKFDIVHSYLFSENILGTIAAKIAGVKVMITSRRDTGMLVQGDWQHILAYRFTNRWVDKIICVSEAVKRVVLEKEKVEPKKLEVIYNGVDIEKSQSHKVTRSQVKASLGIRDDEYVVGMIANFSWIKGHKDFIQAVPLVLKEVPNTKFLLIGDGILRSNIENAIRNTHNAIQNKVLFLGSRKDIPELLSAMDVSVNASYSEGMSNTILELMAAGVSVVATGVDGNLETVIDGETGILVGPKNPMAIAEAIINILKNKELARKMSQNAKRLVQEKFTSEIMIKNMEEVYRRLLKPKIAFIFSQFPCYDETFILREMNQLRASGLNFWIYSIKRCRDKIIHDDAKELMKHTRYLSLFSLKLILINLYFLFRHPGRYLSAFIGVFSQNIQSKTFFLKSIGLFPQAVGFAWVARKDKISHIHGQWATYPATYAYVISKLNNIPFSFTGHAHDIYLDTTGLKKKIEKARFVLTCTEDNKKYLLELFHSPQSTMSSSPQIEDKIIVSYHGVDLERFKTQKAQGQSPSGTVPSPFKIFSVGSLLPCKGFDILIDACKIFRDRGIDFECTIAGGGPLQQKLQLSVVSCQLSDRVKFTGYITQDKLIPLYKEADVFALPVRPKIHWGISNVLLEAMATGIPVITVALPSTSELIDDGKTGLIVPEENPQALADALARLYNDVELRETVGSAGCAVVSEKFNVVKNARRLREILESGT